MSPTLQQIRHLLSLNMEPPPYEVWGLYEVRRGEIDALVPHPACCELAQAHLRYRVSFGDEKDSGRAGGSWTLGGVPGLVACPFCRTLLPVMWRKPVPPEGVCRSIDGGRTCTTCGDEVKLCICDPMESAFEPVPADVSPHTLNPSTYSTADVEVYFDPLGYHSGKEGCWRARLHYRPGIHDAGPSKASAFRAFVVTAATFGLQHVEEASS